MSMNNQGRPTGAGQPRHRGDKRLVAAARRGAAAVRDRRTEHSGVDLPESPIGLAFLGGFERKAPLDLPASPSPRRCATMCASAGSTIRSTAGIYPLGSCTMKHNPRLNEKMARLPGFADIHPLQPVDRAGRAGADDELARWLMTLTNTAAVCLTPKAGAHGEALRHDGDQGRASRPRQGHRNVVLVPESAHGTNPATAALPRLQVKPDAGARRRHGRCRGGEGALGPDVAAIMLTNPNTCGLFEPQVIEIAEAVHEAGAYFYCDGANFNAIMGVVRPGDLGIDAMHINLHKTFSTPHGGGGPGAGPVVLSRGAGALRAGAVRAARAGFALVEHAEGTAAFGRMTAFHGQMGMFVRALTYMLSHGGDGLRRRLGGRRAQRQLRQGALG
jgi:glycine dehydrogenase subunit 2